MKFGAPHFLSIGSQFSTMKTQSILFMAVLASLLALGCLGSPAKVPQGQTGATYWRGAEKAVVTVYEYSDFECPACKAAEPDVEAFISNYQSKGVRIVYRQFPLEGIHPQSHLAAIASECAAREGKFWQYHDLLFANSPKLSRDDLISYAAQANLSVNFSACLNDTAAAANVDAGISEGMSLGLKGTPSFAVGDVIITGGEGLQSKLSRAVDIALGG
jgi:protein-disulfide isomerase